MNTISKNSLMYWLHKAYTTEEYLALNDGYWTYECDEDGMVTDGRRIDTPKPVDGCSWYRKGFLLLLLTTLLVVGGLAVSAIAAYLVVNFLAFLLGGWVVFSWVNVDLAMILFLVSSFMFGILLLTDTLEGKTPLIPKYVSKQL